jgi:hypothetical protein
MDEERVVEESVKKLADRLSVGEKVVSVYVEYYLSLLEPDTPDSQDNEEAASAKDAEGSQSKRHRRRRLDGFTEHESTLLKILISIIEIDEIAMGTAWSSLQPYFPNRSADDLRRKYGNMQKNQKDSEAFEKVKMHLLRLTQLSAMGIIGEKPVSDDLQVLNSWYNEHYGRLDEIEESIVKSQPNSLAEAKSWKWVELAIVAPGFKEKELLSSLDHISDYMNSGRKSLLYSSNQSCENVHMEELVKYGFATSHSDTFKLSSKVREWIQNEPGLSIPAAMQQGEPLVESNIIDQSIFDVYRLYGRGSLKLETDGKSINYSVRVDKPTSDQAETSSKEHLWFDLDGDFSQDIFYKSLFHVFETICVCPGIKEAAITSHVLTRREIQYLCEYLVTHDYVSKEDERLLPIF